ncbi:hypothetical protein RHMOL_Rhmol02G0144800 [Rhododendron molle]|uniref:Uncharacterized protein n=1 Tax=Rhododendron molle TaxID=49168 RepID=A0ACC0PPT7_RHOML|nr:hypothetical protein RHMOL_Rhmol02G0144800 [Rhododendron molle]
MNRRTKNNERNVKRLGFGEKKEGSREGEKERRGDRRTEARGRREVDSPPLLATAEKVTRLGDI